MKVRWDFRFWNDYIDSHPDKIESRPSSLGGYSVFCAPYKDGVWVRRSYAGLAVIFYKPSYTGPNSIPTPKTSDQWGNLLGPAIIDNDPESNMYMIDDKRLTKEEWENHPLVIAAKIDVIIEEVLSED